MAHPQFPHLFSPLSLRGVTLKNRIFSTGHMTTLVSGGLPNDDLVAYHEARAAGGAGLIIVPIFAWTQGSMFEESENLLYVLVVHLIVDFFLFAAILHHYYPGYRLGWL